VDGKRVENTNPTTKRRTMMCTNRSHNRAVEILASVMYRGGVVPEAMRMHDVDGCPWCRSWKHGGAPSDGVRGGHMRGGRVAILETRRGGILATTSAKRGRVLMRGGLVGSIPADPDPKTSTSKKQEGDDPDPSGHTIRLILGFAKPCALLLRRGFFALFSGHHTETPPEVVADLSTPRE